MALHDQHVLILGLGESGLSMARWCARQGARVTVADTRAEPPQGAALLAQYPNISLVTGPLSAELIEGQDIRAVFKSPGLSPADAAPVWQAAQAMGLWTGTELSLFVQALQDLKAERGYQPQILAITGTNGKTTVTALTGQLLERAAVRVAVAGNIGPTLLDTLTRVLDEAPPWVPPPAPSEDVVEALEPAPAMEASVTEQPDLGLPDVWVLELSSFQLDEVVGFEPTAATILNITEDHLDWHGSMDAYVAAKSRIWGQQGLMVVNREDPRVMAMVPPEEPARKKNRVIRRCLSFGADMPTRPGDYGMETVNGMTWLVRAHEADETRKRSRDEVEEVYIQRLMPADALRIRGEHNALNALAALALACSTGSQLAPMLYGLREYGGEPHRAEPVAVVNDVEYVNDSKGTNVGATVAALRGLGRQRSLVVILGGDGKGQDFSPLLDPVRRHARALVLIGRDAPRLREALVSSGVPMQEAATLPEAVEKASRLAQPGDAVLLSPACASLDMFRNYGHRGEVFVQAVHELADESASTLEVSA